MSKIGKQPIIIPENVTAMVADGAVLIKGKSESVAIRTLPGTEVKIKEDAIVVSSVGAGKQARANWGTLRALIANAIKGQVEGFSKTLILEGVGFRAAKEGEGLVLSLGFSHPVNFPARTGISFEVGKNNAITVKGTDKALVGQVAAEIRALKKPEPYKGKGFHYSDEVVPRKAGKKAAASAGK
ncbi:MAG: 50S ribosomal protein L6 [Candidatus Brennerbacteria bacterium]|nr:50S ribosomal protein L6 [Candidatus Brennerbacteria bacterium]